MAGAPPVCLCVFNLAEEDAFSEVMLLPLHPPPTLPPPLFFFNRANANNSVELETSASVGNCVPVAVYSEKESPNPSY